MSRRMQKAMKRMVVVAVLLALLVAVPALAQPARSRGDYKQFELNTDGRAWIVDGVMQMRVVQGGRMKVSGLGWIDVNPEDEVEVHISDEAPGKAHIWIGSDGWLDWRKVSVESIYINGVLVAENTQIEKANFKVDVSSIHSTVEIRVLRSPSGWTQFTFNGTTIINGNDDSEIRVVGVRPTTSTPLNIDLSSSEYAIGAAATAYINGAEVPELGSPLSLVGLALAASLLAVVGRAVKARDRVVEGL
ncbi:hypothetical protein [Hyperthermus butylicus]|nr:hypothetical protein [Hyperthermus butylicus]